QEQSGILMQLGVEFEVAGALSREALEQTLAYLIAQWPQLGQHLYRRIGGLAWRGGFRLAQMLRIALRGRDDGVAEWRNQPIDPFREPPFQVLAVLNDNRNTLAFRTHHAVVDGVSLLIICTDAMRALSKILAGEDPREFHPSTQPHITNAFRRKRFPV